MRESLPADELVLGAVELERIFDEPDPLTVGLEEEVMLLDPSTLDLAPRAGEVLQRLEGDRRFKPELPASQIELLTEPTHDLRETIAALAEARRVLRAAADGVARPAACGVHPFAAAHGELTDHPRYERIQTTYGEIAHRQLIASLQVQIAVGDADRTLHVYNELRSYLPELAALAANGPVYEGRDTGLASVRPKIAETLPRQGVPPAIVSWDDFAEQLRWGEASETVPEPRLWWWELRPHPGFGTLEIRVPDAQTTLGDAAGVVGFVVTLVAWLSEQADAERFVPATWRIQENRWSAARNGVEGTMADLRTGTPEPTRERLRRLLETLEPTAARLGSSEFLGQAWRLVERNGAMGARESMRQRGPKGLASWLADRFLDASDLQAEVSRPVRGA